MAQVMVAASTLAEPTLPIPYLGDNSPKSSPITPDELLRYLRAFASARRLKAEELRFVRTARLDDKQYWLWRYAGDRRRVCYATVLREPDGSAWMSHHEDARHLNAEQVLLADYHSAF